MLLACIGFSFHLMALLPKGEEGKSLLNTQQGESHAKYQNHLGYTRDLPNQQPTWGFPGSHRRSHSLNVLQNIVFLA